MTVSPRRRTHVIAAVAVAAVAVTSGALALIPGPSASSTPSAASAPASAPQPARAAVVAPRTASPTAPAKPVKTAGVRSNVGGSEVYGTAIPIVLTFSHAIPKADRAAVQKRLSVTSSPAQVGAWNWFSDHEVHFRPKAQWQPGTKVALTAKTGGLALSNGYTLRNNLTVNTNITKRPLSIAIDGKTHMLTVRIKGKVVERMPASLGKGATPSSSGDMVIMTRAQQMIFDSSLGGGTPVNAPGGYRELVKWDMRLTWGGEFIHAAPWSVKHQGKSNVSHGCTNVSTADAKFIYLNSHVGDPVDVTGTPRALTWGNGWTDWNVGWNAYIAGSALPVTG